MKTKLIFAGSLLALLMGTQAASAQDYQSGQSSGVASAFTTSAPASQTALSYGSQNYGGGFLESSIAEGLGAMMAGAGQYNLNSAQAVDILENARAKNIENYKNAIEARYAIKRANAEYRAAKFEQERMTPEMLTRISQAKLPDRLSAAEYSPRTGELRWPAVLLEPEFAADRVAIDSVFAQRQPEDVGMTSVFYREVSQRCQRMHNTMLSHIDDFSTTDSIAARRFLKSLEYEARHIPEAGLAMNDR